MRVIQIEDRLKVRDQNVIQAGDKAPHEEQRGKNSQRLCVIPGWLMKLRRSLALRASYHLSCRHIFSSTYQIKFFACHDSSALPPGFGLHAEGEATCFILKRNSADEAAEAVGPACIS